MIYEGLKPALIDLEVEYNTTGRKQAEAVQRERLSERGLKGNNLRVCKVCNQELDIRLFQYKSGKPKKDGLQLVCKPCKLGTLQRHRQHMRKLVNRWKVIKTYQHRDHLQVCDSPAHDENYI